MILKNPTKFCTGRPTDSFSATDRTRTQHIFDSRLSYLGSTVENSLFLSPVTHLEIEDLIANLNSSKSIGPNSVPTNMLKILKHHISHPLTEIVNQSFLKGTFLSKLKIAKVVPAVKKGDPEIR